MADCFSLENATGLVEEKRNYARAIGSITLSCGEINILADAIEQLLAENAKLKAELDAAVRDLKISSDCEFCKYDIDDPMFCEKSPRGDECMGKRWEWRGVQDEQNN